VEEAFLHGVTALNSRCTCSDSLL